MHPDQKAQIPVLLESGLDSRTIANQIGVSVQTVAAVKAHITMGTYERPATNKPRISRPEVHIQTANSSLQALGELIDNVEAGLRDYIDRTLSTKTEDYLRLIPSDVLQSVDQKINEHLKRHPYEKSAEISKRQRLDYMDSMDYCKIILANWSHFGERFGSKGEVEKHFLNVKEARNALKHGRELNSVVRKQGEASAEWLTAVLPNARG